MISFIWPRSAYDFLSGIGGSENYTKGHIRELTVRGIEAEVVTLEGGPAVASAVLAKNKIRPLPVHAISLLEKPVFVLKPMLIQTAHQAHVILHCPPPPAGRGEHDFYIEGVKDKKIITPSRYAANLWAEYTGRGEQDIAVVYPFADEIFGQQTRKISSSKKTKVLIPNRLTPDKGIYTFLAALHFDYLLPHDRYRFDVLNVGANLADGKILTPLLKAHPFLNVLPPSKNPSEMAKLMSKYDIVLLPSNAQFFHEMFGMVSVEAQHAGCRVVASHDGGLPETDCGGLTLVEPDNPYELALGIAKTAHLPLLTASEREKARQLYTLKKSVDALIEAVR